MRRNRTVSVILLLLYLLIFNGCSGESFEYVDRDPNGSWQMNVPVGTGAATFEFGIPTNYALPLVESDYPTIIAHYSSLPKDANRLKKLEIELLVDGRAVDADQTEYQAGHFNTFVDFPETECCENLGDRIRLGEMKYTEDRPFTVQIVKRYKSLKRLPPEVMVRLTATTDRGKVETVHSLKLSAYKSSGYIRFH